jgi:sialic acid synthase SpsE
MEFKIGNVNFGGDKTVVIAEAGVNHLGRMDYAEELIKTAARAGADIVKFQTYKAKNLTTIDAPRFWNWEGEHEKNGSQFDSYSMLDSFEEKEYKNLIDLCKKYNIEFMSTPFDEGAVDMLVDIGMKGFKIASCDLNNYPFLKYIARKKLPMLISTGASTINEIKKAVDVIENEGNSNIGIMHCTLCYPTEPKDSNLLAINDIKQKFPKYLIGLSDHTLGTIVPAASILLGVGFVEKHYTFDKKLPDSADHWLSLNEEELSAMIKNIRILEVAKGTGEKIVLDCEMPAHNFARRSIVATENIQKGTVITESMIAMKRPGTGLAPEFKDRVIGSVAKKLIKIDSLIDILDIK